MFLNKEAISEFQSLYSKEFQIKIAETEALKFGAHLVGLVKAVYGNQLPDLKAIDNINNQIQN